MASWGKRRIRSSGIAAPPFNINPKEVMTTLTELAESFDRLQRQVMAADGQMPEGNLNESFREARRQFAFGMFEAGKTVRQIGRRLDLTVDEVLEVFRVPNG